MYKILVAPTTQADQYTLQASMVEWDGVYKHLLETGQSSSARGLARRLAHESTGPDTAKRITVSPAVAQIILAAAGVSF